MEDEPDKLVLLGDDVCKDTGKCTCGGEPFGHELYCGLERIGTVDLHKWEAEIRIESIKLVKNLLIGPDHEIRSYGQIRDAIDALMLAVQEDVYG